MKLSNVRKDLYAEVINLLPYGIEKSSHSLIINFGDIFILFGFGIVDLKKSYSTSFYYGIGSHKFSSLYNVIIKEKQLNYQKTNTLQPVALDSSNYLMKVNTQLRSMI